MANSRRYKERKIIPRRLYTYKYVPRRDAAVSSSVKKTYLSVGEGPAPNLQEAVPGEVSYALENSVTYTALTWHTLTGPSPSATAAAEAATAKGQAVKVTGADAELEEIVILGKEAQQYLPFPPVHC